MTAADEWRDLARRCREATGPDREIDADIYIAINIPAERAGRIDKLDGYVGWWPKNEPYVGSVETPKYSFSLDAIVALIEKTMPGYDWRVGKCPIDGADKYDAQLYHEDDAKGTDEDASSPALALCAAYCEARAAVEDAA